MKQENIKTLYLQNLPRRPVNKESFIRNLLKCINRNNIYVLNPSKPIPASIDFNEYNELKESQDKNLYLDESLGLISISLSRSLRLRNQGFLTFESHELAQSFMDRYQNNKLKVSGRIINISFAKKESFLGLYLDNERVLQKALRTKYRKEDLENNQHKLETLKLRRKQRRLRSKLRSKGVDDEQIKAAVTGLTQKVTATINEKKPVPLALKQETRPPKHDNEKLVEPNSILLLTDLPSGCTSDQIKVNIPTKELKEIRLVSVRNVAFVEYEDIEAATVALKEMVQKLTKLGNNIKVTYAKK